MLRDDLGRGSVRNGEHHDFAAGTVTHGAAAQLVGERLRRLPVTCDQLEIVPAREHARADAPRHVARPNNRHLHVTLLVGRPDSRTIL